MFEEWLNHKLPQVNAVAAELDELKYEMDEGMLSESEFIELSKDILDLNKINEMSKNLAIQLEIRKAFLEMLSIVSIF